MYVMLCCGDAADFRMLAGNGFSAAADCRLQFRWKTGTTRAQYCGRICAPALFVVQDDDDDDDAVDDPTIMMSNVARGCAQAWRTET